MIDPNKELFKWGPIDGKILYIEDFITQCILFKKNMNLTWPDLFTHIKNNKVLIVVDNEAVLKYGKEIFKEFILNKEKCKETYDIWIGFTKKIQELCFKHRDSDLSKLSDEELSSQLKEFYELDSNFWNYGFIPEMANWGGERILREKIEKAHPNDFTEIFEALTAPEDLSFYQIEERDLLSNQDFEEHAKKYFWIRNSYGGVHFITTKEFKEEFSKHNAEEKIKQINEFSQKTKEKKFEIQKKFNLSEEIIKIGEQLSFSIWWQDLRKKYIFMMLHVIHHFAKEIAKRNNLTIDDVENYTPMELMELAANKTKIDLTQRKIGYLSYYDEEKNDVTFTFGEKANDLVKQYTNIEVEEGITEIKGMVTSKGIVKGRVRILSGARHFDSMKEGEILVTSMTSPEFIVAMRKAAAIVTDEGGMTCHAAIVSRELGTPCIVATKIATRVLKTGDLVEVDANKGVVKIIK